MTTETQQPAVGAQVHLPVRPLVERLRAGCTDWDGSQMADETQPMDCLTAGDVREAAHEIERLRARVAELEAAEEGAKVAFGHVVEQKQAAEKECMRLQGLLAAAYADIRRLSRA